MPQNNFRPELLAPAGSKEALIAAVQNGADAVYLGGRQFSARQSAANFDRQEMREALEFAHTRGVKINVTVNTLLADSELDEVLDYVYFLAESGVDAVILQDIGLAGLLHRLLPLLPLHASTQMTCHNTAGAAFLREQGFSRIILARETSLADIAAIRREVDVELETFVHGALCICFSGQCLMSSMIGGRSGNRGRCAQPCRMAYQLTDRRGKLLAAPETAGQYLLSPRDLNMSAHLNELLQAGVASLKIEGRMKRPEYVATVVRIYRQLLDRCLAANGGAAGGASVSAINDAARSTAAASKTSGAVNRTAQLAAVTPDGRQQQELEQIFNRDFTTGYFFGNPGAELMSSKRPNNRGTKLGRIVAYQPETQLADIQLEDRLALGDGIEVWVTRGGRAGATVKQLTVQGRKIGQAEAGTVVRLEIAGKIHVGDRVFKTCDAALMEKARKSYTSEREADRIPLTITVNAADGQPLCLELTDDLGLSVAAQSQVLAEPARKRPLTREYLQQQLDRLGNTPFYIAALDCRISGEVIVPASEINETRRRAVAELLALRTIHSKKQSTLPTRQQFARCKEGLLAPLSGDVCLKREAWDLTCQGTAALSRAVPRLTVKVSNLAAVQAAVQAGADEVYFGGESFHSQPAWKIEDIKKGVSLCRRAGAVPLLSTPRVVDNREAAAFVKLMQQLQDCSWGGIITGSSGLARLLQQQMAEQAIKLPLLADFALNVFNSAAVDVLRTAGFSRLTLSPELTLAQIQELARMQQSGQAQQTARRQQPNPKSAAEQPITAQMPVPTERPERAAQPGLEIIVHGALPLMVSRHCPLGAVLGGRRAGSACSQPCRGLQAGLQDRLQLIFPLETDQNCQMHLFNAQELCLLTDLEVILNIAGLSAVRIEASAKDAAYVQKTVALYRQALDQFSRQGWLAEQTTGKEQLALLSPQGLTRGHFFRGVLN